MGLLTSSVYEFRGAQQVVQHCTQVDLGTRTRHCDNSQDWVENNWLMFVLPIETVIVDESDTHA